MRNINKNTVRQNVNLDFLIIVFPLCPKGTLGQFGSDYIIAIFIQILKPLCHKYNNRENSPLPSGSLGFKLIKYNKDNYFLIVHNLTGIGIDPSISVW